MGRPVFIRGFCPLLAVHSSGRLCNSLSVSSSLKEGSLFISHGTVIKIKLEFSSVRPGIILILVTVHNLDPGTVLTYSKFLILMSGVNEQMGLSYISFFYTLTNSD